MECIYAILYVSVFKENAGLALALLSVAVNTLCLPLYTKAEKLQEIERETQKRMAKKLARIRKCFTGDERWLLITAYYRQNHYHPIYALRSSLSLLLQIPFFIAAYSFLSHLTALQGKSFLFINDLSQQDAAVGGFSINILPIIMTLINILAGIIYSKGFPLREKIQLYAMSAIFLVLLYNSPSALVLYWTMNNLYSLAKNILFKIKNPIRIVYFAGCALCFAFMIYVCFIRYNFPSRAFRNKTFSVLAFLFFTGMPLYIKSAKYIFKKRLEFLFEIKNASVLFVLSCAILWLFITCFIPLNTAASDPAYFAQTAETFETNFLSLLSAPMIQGFGLFFFWTLCLFFLAPRPVRSVLAVFGATAAICVLLNFFVFDGNYGIVSQTLSFSLPDGVYMRKSFFAQLVNIIVCFFVFVLICAIASGKGAKGFKPVSKLFSEIKSNKILPPLLTLCIISVCALLIIKIASINRFFLNPTSEQITQSDSFDSFSQKITLSKNEKNVLFIMLDGAINSYFPLIAKERADVASAFQGFTYYPNTISFFRRTLFGTPPMFGGYEYSTYNMNKRADVSMREKHNEALLLMPTIFHERNFDVTVSNLPYLNYYQPIEEGFYEKRGITNIEIIGRWTDKFLKEELDIEEYAEPVNLDKLLRRNLLMFAIVKTSVFSVRDFLYQNGKYWGMTDFTENAGAPRSTLDNYSALFYLTEITAVTDSQNGAFTILVNDLTHDSAYLQYPDYEPAKAITERGDNFFGNDSFKYYHVNAASYILLAKWFKFLQENNVWNNTRVVIVSDHGDGGITHPNFSSFQNNHVLPYSPILLVKDFDAMETPFQTDSAFMTNADAPLLALKDIVGNPINPFTRKPLAPEKENGVYIFTGGWTNTSYYQGAVCLESDSRFYYVRDNIYDEKNWRETRYRDFATALQD
ncbi:MAG: YidC/Oxa1 family membrane protein insertase [Treponema sp.]|jgi:YidC/Oxa1 family membrane protein insertase|nr:YidC/Oxa1 family membrane protein insertase [Treponema sp.]